MYAYFARDISVDTISKRVQVRSARPPRLRVVVSAVTSHHPCRCFFHSARVRVLEQEFVPPELFMRRNFWDLAHFQVRSGN